MVLIGMMLSVFAACVLTKEVLTLIYYWFMDMLVIKKKLAIYSYIMNI